MTEHSWTTSTRISVTGSNGWAPVERLEIPHVGGRALVRVERFPAAADADVDTLAALHGRAAADGSDSGTAPHEVLGSTDGRRRTVTWTDPEGTRLNAVVDYALGRGSLVVITTVTPVDEPALAVEAAAIASSVHLTDPVAMGGEELPLRPGRADFGEVAEAWLAGTRPDVGQEHVMTTEESFAAARHFGVAMLPGADTAGWDQLDAAQRDLAAAVAWRSLEARGAGSGTDLGEALQLAASHDLIVMVSERGTDEPRTQWFAARPERMVRLRPVGPGLIALTTHPTVDLADLVLAGAGPDARMTASAVLRSDGIVVGDETSWSADTSARDVREALGRLVTRSHVGGAS